MWCLVWRRRRHYWSTIGPRSSLLLYLLPVCIKYIYKFGQICCTFCTNTSCSLHKYTFDDFLLVPSHPLYLLWFCIKYFVRIVQKYLQAISLIFHYWSASWHPIMGDISSTSLTLSQNVHQSTFFLLLIGEASLDIDSPSFWRFSCPLRIVNIGGLWTIMDNRLRK